MASFTFDGAAESPAAELTESAAGERLANGFTTACPERSRHAQMRWHGVGGFYPGGVRYLKARVTVSQTCNHPNFRYVIPPDYVTVYRDAAAGYTFAIVVEFTLDQRTGRLTYELVSRTEEYRGTWDTHHEWAWSNWNNIAKTAGNVFNMISVNGNWEWSYNNLPAGNTELRDGNNHVYWATLAEAIFGPESGCVFTSAGTAADATHYSGTTENRSYNFPGTGGNYGDLPPSALLFELVSSIEIELLSPWTPADALAELDNLWAALPALDEIADGSWASANFSPDYPANGAPRPFNPASDFATWDSQVDLQPASQTILGGNGGVNNACTRSSTIDVLLTGNTQAEDWNGNLWWHSNDGQLVRRECRRYFLDPLAKVVTTNWDGSTSCLTVPTPTILSDGRWGWDFGLTGPIQSLDRAVPRKMELTVGVACA